MTRAVVVAFHQYTPFGKEFYAPLLDSFIAQMAKYQDEFDMLYLIDSTWDIGSVKEEWGISKVKILKVDPSLRYYDAYKSVLPEIEEDLVLFLDDDVVIYREGEIRRVFTLLTGVKEVGKNKDIEVVSIYDTCGDYKTDKLNGGNKFCLYFFATKKDLLMKYLDIDWAPHMPHSETIGLLTEAMLNDDVVPYEIVEDKSNILFFGYQDGEKSKDLGYYHIRSGSLPAYLLATKKYGDTATYRDYIGHQPKSEYLRQMAWYYTMCDTEKHMGLKNDIFDLLKDVGVDIIQWQDYWDKFREYHGLK